MPIDLDLTQRDYCYWAWEFITYVLALNYPELGEEEGNVVAGTGLEAVERGIADAGIDCKRLIAKSFESGSGCYAVMNTYPEEQCPYAPEMMCLNMVFGEWAKAIMAKKILLKNGVTNSNELEIVFHFKTKRHLQRGNLIIRSLPIRHRHKTDLSLLLQGHIPNELSLLGEKANLCLIF